MQTTKIFKTAWLFAVLSIAGLTTTQAQTVWTNKAGGDWNTAINWNPNLIPIETTNAIITNSTAFTVTYSGLMAASSVGSVQLGGAGAGEILTLTAGGFNVAGTTTVNASSTLNVNAGAVMTNGTLNQAIQTSAVNVNGGTMTNGTTQVSNNGSNDGGPLKINSGIVSLGDATIRRAGATIFSSGLTIFGGTVSANSVTIGNGNSANSYSTMSVGGGTLDIANSLVLGNSVAVTAGRAYSYYQTNGTVTCHGVVATGVQGPNQLDFFTVSQSGVFNTTGIVIFTNPVTALTYITNGGTIYLGSGGIFLTNVTSLTTNNISLNDQGLFGAAADWTANSDMTLRSGTFTFQAADSGGTPHNITLNSNLRGGTGALKKTGGGNLNLNGTNIYTGNTIINNGSVVLGAGATIASAKIIVGSGATFDVSAVAGGFVLSNQTLSGSGVVTGAVSAVSSATIDPGSNALNGTLSFSNSLAESGGVINHFDISGAPSPNNDLVFINGDLNVNVSATNTVDISGAGLVSGNNYILIQYGGNFNGGITNFALSISSPNGSLTNDTVAKTISFVPLTVPRGPTNTIWIGNPVNTNWDTVTTDTNWLNGTNLDFFVAQDNVQFTDAGASNSPVNIVGAVQPASILFNSQSNYVFASTSGGWISGTASLTVTNTGKLTMAIPTNTYTGVTTIGSGVLEISQVANGLAASPIGAASLDSGNLVILNGTLRYIGANGSMDRGVTMAGTNAIFDVANSGTSLTVSGDLTGSSVLTKIGAGTLILSGGNASSASTVSNGTLQANGAVSAIGSGPVNFAGGTLRMNVSGQPTYPNTLNVIANSTLVAAGGNNNIVTGPWYGSNTLTIVLASNATFTINNAMTTNFTGTILLSDTNIGFFRFNAGGNGSGAQQSTGSPTATFDLGNSFATLLNRNGGALAFGIYDLGGLSGGTNSSVKGASNGGGAINQTYYSIGAKNLDSVFAGTIQNGGGGSGATTAIIKVGTGTLTLSGVNTYSGVTIVSNGVLAVSSTNGVDGSIGSSATIDIKAGAVIDATLETVNAGTLTLGSQTLQGNGTIRGSLDTGGSGIVSPGGGPGGDIGILTVTNTITLGGTSLMKLNRNNSQTSDRLVSSTAGVINYGGTLLVTNIGAPLQVGDTFTNFSATTLGGSFTLDLPRTYTWDTSKLNVNGSIKVTGIVPPPSITKVVYTNLANGFITFYGSYPNATNYPSDSLVVNILTSTNIAAPLSSWTVVGSGLFDDGTVVNPPGQLIDSVSVTPGLTVPVDPNLPQSFFILQLP